MAFLLNFSLARYCIKLMNIFSLVSPRMRVRPRVYLVCSQENAALDRDPLCKVQAGNSMTINNTDE
jgi:hypothetical protein